MDNIVAFLLDTVWIGLFLVAMFYNMARRRDLKPAVWLSGVLALIYAANHIATASLFDGKPYSEHVTFQYILWSAACLLIVISMLLITLYTRTRFYWFNYACIFIMCIDVTGNMLMHIDQNIVGLNDLGAPNAIWSKDRWWLWYWYSTQSNINNGLLLAMLFLPVGIKGGFMNQGENIKRVFKSLLNGFNVFHFLGSVNTLYARVDVIQDLIDAMPVGEQQQALSLLVSAKELLYRHDETGVDHLEAITLLLDGAAHCALQRPTPITATTTIRARSSI